jgi:outer membrane lipoprotein-sorting protein
MGYQPMDKKTALIWAIILLGQVGLARPAGSPEQPCAESTEQLKADPLEATLEQLKQQTRQLGSYQCRIKYLFSQPVFDSQTLRKGRMYYKKFNDKSTLRINFETIKQDDEPQQSNIEQYIFDGVWLTHIDYQLKEIKRHQMTEPNQPADAFELARENFPIIGFSKTEDLRKDFEIVLIDLPEETAKNLIQLRLKVKPDSRYYQDYTSVDFWIDKSKYLPARVRAVTAEADIYEISFLEAKVNQKLKDKVFEIKVPKDFGKVKFIPLKKN